MSNQTIGSYMKYQGGFSIVEVMVAAAIMGALALGLSKLTTDQMKSTKTIESKFEYNSILNEIRETLGNPDSCFASFGNMNAKNTTGIVDIKRWTPDGNVSKYPVNSNYGNGAIKIVSYRLDVTDNDPSVVVSDNPVVRGTTNLVIRLDLGINRTYTQQFIEKKIRLNVETTGVAGVPPFGIVKCTSTGELADMEDRYVNANEDDTMDGTLTITDGHEIIMASDKNLKHDIRSLNSSLQDLKKIRPVIYKWNRDNSESFGFIAQELEQVFPSLVQMGNNNYLAVDYIQVTPLLVKGIQELDQENQKLKREQKETKKILNQLLKDICSKDPSLNSCKSH